MIFPFWPDIRDKKIAAAALMLGLMPTVLAAVEPADSSTHLPVNPPPVISPDAAPEQRNVFENLHRDLLSFNRVSQVPGLSFHRSLYVMPLTWSPQYHGDQTELIYQLSLKQRLLNRNFYFAYTQKSFWQVYNAQGSRPFRETNYNPEVFYRWKPRWQRAPGLGLDIGLDHESNGKALPDSRSWNRIISAVFYETPSQLYHLRLWYRLPESRGRDADDPTRDDNPDIYRYYGYGEFRWQNRLSRPGQQLDLMLRGNPRTGYGAIDLTYSAPFSDWAFWNISLWHGYGESLIDYDHSTTRLGIGLMLSR